MSLKTIRIVAMMVTVFFSRCGTSTPPTAKIDAKLDMIMYIGLANFDTARKEILDVFPSYFEMAEDKVRLGAWCLSDNETTTIVGLTGNETHFTNALREFTPTGLQTTLRDVDVLEIKKIFNATGRSRIPQIVYRFDSYIWNKTEVEKAHYPGSPCHSSFQLRGIERVREFYGGCGRFGRSIREMLCGGKFDSCTYDKSGACMRFPSGLFQIDPWECSKFPDLKPKPCRKTICEQFCYGSMHQKKISEICSGKCGKIQLTSSDILDLNKKMISRCPAHLKEFQCPCTGSPATETSQNLSTTDSPKTVRKITVSPQSVSVSAAKYSSSPTGDLKRSSGGSSKTVSETKPNAQAQAKQQDTTPPGPGNSKDFPWWVIGVVVAVVAVALLGIILAVVISRRRRVQKKPAPAAVETSAPFTTPKRKAEVKGRRGIGAAVGGESEAGKAEESVGVSLKEDWTTKKKKAAGSSIKSSTKGKNQSTEKSSRATSKMGKGSKSAMDRKRPELQQQAYP